MSTLASDLKRRSATLTDVARVAGVSKMTVSNVLNGRRKNSPHEETIRQVVRDLNFSPNANARRLSRGGDSNVVALFSTALDRGVAIQKLRILDGLLTGKGFEAPYYTHSSVDGVDMSGHESLLASLRSQRPRAIICNAGKLSAGAILELQHFQKEGGVVVAYDASLPELDCDKVYFDREDNTYQATRHLTQLGHVRIGYHRSGSWPTDDPRARGYLRALAEAGIPANDKWVYGVVGVNKDTAIGWYEDAGWQVAEQFLAQKKERPTAMVITNDYAAIGFAGTLARAGLRVPEDVSVVGSEDAPIARHGLLRLTTAAQPIETIAHGVFELLMDRLDGRYRGPARTIAVRGDLVVRESTLPLQPQKRKAALKDFDIAPSVAGYVPVLGGRNGRSSS